jgi:glycosyltransferase involved in cell wall biosynthesis
MSERLRVGLNLTYLVEDSGGSGRYARELIAGMLATEPQTAITAWIGSTAPVELAREPWADSVRWVHLPVPGVGTPWHLWHELVAIGIDARRRGLDVVHGLANIVPLFAPGVARVVTILDVIWIHHPEAMDLRARLGMRTLAPLCGHRADRVIAISKAAADDVSSTLRISRRKFDVTPLGITPRDVDRPPPAEHEVRARLGLRPGPLVLCVAAKRRHKNLDGLIRAMAQLSEGSANGARPLLVLPGSPTAYERELRELALDVGVADDVVFPDWVSNDELESLYGQASCFVLPSFQEGFGLPVLEAMAHGVPVACSAVSSLPEVAGDAALYFDPCDESQIAAQIRRLLADRTLAEQLIGRGYRRLQQFTWRRTAERTLASYRSAIAGRR